MEYDKKAPHDIQQNGNTCSNTERQSLTNAIDHTLDVVKKSFGNYDEDLFRKWFGKDTDK
jgi:hypothetical protein